MRCRFVSSALFFLTVGLPVWIVPVCAQANASKLGAASISKGEIRLDGRIKAITGPRGFDIEAVSFTSQVGKRFEFEEAKPKSVVGDAKTRVLAGNLTQALEWKEVKLGMRVALIGRDSAQGLRARLVILTDHNSLYHAGSTIRLNRAVSVLVTRGRVLFDAHDFQGAMRVFRQAVNEARGLNDVAGTAAALGFLGSAYRELEQTANAENAYKEALKLGEAAPEGAGLGTLYHNLGLLYLDNDRDEEALKMLEKAHALRKEDSEFARASTMRALGSAYFQTAQFERAISLCHKVAPVLLAHNDFEGAATMHLAIATAQRNLNNPEGQAAALRAARPIIEKVTDAAKKAQFFYSLGVNFKQLGDKSSVRVAWNASIELYLAAKDLRNAVNVRRELQQLDAPKNPDAPPAVPATPIEAA